MNRLTGGRHDGGQRGAPSLPARRGQGRFPQEFTFALTREEILSISQSVTSLAALKFSKSVHAFMEHGALQAASVVNSPQAVQMSLYIIRAFVRMREELTANIMILKRLAEVDRSLLKHDVALRDVYRKLQPLLQPPPEPPKRRMGFNADNS
jgi:hypothetical protein